MDIIAIFAFLCLGLLLVILVLVLINAIRRTFFTCNGSSSPSFLHGRYNPGEKCVDLYVTSVDSLPGSKQALPGMTALIDRGMTDLETGIYILQDNTWTKINVPEVGDHFYILRGEHTGKQHTIRPSFSNEIRPPTETQIIDNDHLYQDLQETTQTVYITNNIHTETFLTVNPANQIKLQTNTMIGRQITIVNTSPTYGCTLVIQNQNVYIKPQTIRHIHLNISGTQYYLGAISVPV